MFDEFWNVWKQALDIKKKEKIFEISKNFSLSLYLYDYYNLS